MDAELDLEIVAAEHRIVAGKVLGVRVGRNADVGHVQQPASSCRSRPALDSVEPRFAENGAFRQIADVARWSVWISRTDNPDDGGEEQHHTRENNDAAAKR